MFARLSYTIQQALLVKGVQTQVLRARSAELSFSSKKPIRHE